MDKPVLAIIYPSTGSTNFETARLPLLLDISVRSDIQIIKIPINPYNALDSHYENYIINLLAGLDHVGIFWLRSVTLIIDQTLILYSLRERGVSVNNYLSLGDEYNMSLKDIFSNSLFYDRIIIYNKDSYERLSVHNKEVFIFWPIVANYRSDLNTGVEEKSHTFCFIGTCYSTRFRDIRLLSCLNESEDFYVAGRGWLDVRLGANVNVSEFISQERYWHKIETSSFCLILNRDDAGLYHVTSKLIDTVSAGTVPVWDQNDPELKKYQIRFKYPLLYFDDSGSIHPKKEFAKLRLQSDYYKEYIRQLQLITLNYLEFEKQVKVLFDHLRLQTESSSITIDVHSALAKRTGRLSIFDKVHRNAVEVKGTEVISPCKVFGIKIPPSTLCYKIKISSTVPVSGGVMMISGLNLLSFCSSLKAVVALRKYIRAKFYSWV